MKIQTIILLCLSVFPLLADNYSEQMRKADQLFKEKKYKAAAAAYDEAILETEKPQERIKAKYGYLESLKKSRSGNRLAAAESLLYEENTLTPRQVADLTIYIVRIANKETRTKAIEFAKKYPGMKEHEMSLVLMAAIEQGGAWDAHVESLLNMKNPAPVARAVALGSKATQVLWAERNPAKALPMFDEALANKHISRDNRQFYYLGKARSHWRLKQIRQAEESYLNALATPAVSNFQNAAYMELLGVYTRTKQGIKIAPMVMRASKDKQLTAKQRQVFVNALEEIQKRIKRKMQEK